MVVYASLNVENVKEEKEDTRYPLTDAHWDEWLGPEASDSIPEDIPPPVWAAYLTILLPNIMGGTV
ncbi:hypothetical protein ACH9L7_16705 (plasmid) [Haloferax sp. S1W]|uniref:hypothetical protein n=1 Tax=Haloferax sp. S1W TaxID=3377110 RepID=UPI0037C4FFCF